MKPGRFIADLKRRNVIPAARSSISAVWALAQGISQLAPSVGAAAITVVDSADSVLPSGTVFTVINNTAATPIGGRFSNLPDGTIIVEGSNTFQADCEGGDGNDLTLTVVP
jgi:hypothetical protein